jgi:hypothetical protein
MSRRGEKKFEPFIFKIDGVEIKVPVTMIKDKDSWSGNTRLITFHAEYEPAGISMTNTDINKLREDVEKELRNWHTIDWSYWIRVRVISAGHHQPATEQIDISFEFFKLGKTKDGTEVHQHIPDPEFEDGKDWDGTIDTKIGFGGSPTKGRPDEGADTSVTYSWNKGMRSLIPATPENVNAVRKFMKMVKTLGKEMQDRFSPISINSTIGLIQKLKDIPMLEEKEKSP